MAIRARAVGRSVGSLAGVEVEGSLLERGCDDDGNGNAGGLMGLVIIWVLFVRVGHGVLLIGVIGEGDPSCCCWFGVLGS